MSGIIDDVVVATWPATVPNILNGDNGDQTTFSPPITELAKRSRFDHDELFTRGIRRVASYSTSLAAKAATTGTVLTGDIARIAGLGFFQYNADTAGETELSPLRFLVTGSAGGIWRNVALGFQSLGVANGSASLDAGGHVPSAQLRGHLVAAYPLPTVGSVTSGGTGTDAFVEIVSNAAAVDILNLAVGDLIVVSGAYQFTPAASNYVSVGLSLKKSNGSPLSTGGFEFATGLVVAPAGYAAGALKFAVSGTYVVQSDDLLTPTSTTLRVYIRQKATTGINVGASLNPALNASFPPVPMGVLHYRNPS